MLHPITEEIAGTFGYIPFSEEEGQEQFQADINWDPEKSGAPTTEIGRAHV
jgi:hypothetical protein